MCIKPPLVVGCRIATIFFFFSPFSIIGCLTCYQVILSHVHILKGLEFSTGEAVWSSNVGHYLPECHVSVGGRENKRTFGWLSPTGASCLIFITLIFKSFHGGSLLKEKSTRATFWFETDRLK